MDKSGGRKSVATGTLIKAFVVAVMVMLVLAGSGWVVVVVGQARSFCQPYAAAGSETFDSCLEDADDYSYTKWCCHQAEYTVQTQSEETCSVCNVVGLLSTCDEYCQMESLLRKQDEAAAAAAALAAQEINVASKQKP